MFWPFMIAFAVIYLLQTVLAMRQATNYTKHYGTLRRRGRVAIGKQKNLLFSGAIVMFLLDEQDVVVEGTRLTGVTVFSRFRPLEGFAGIPVAELAGAGHRELARSVRAAVDNARDNYLLVSEGRVPPEPPGPVTKMFNRLSRKTPAAV